VSGRIAGLLGDHIAGTLDREAPDEVVAHARLHVLDTLAAGISGRTLEAGRAGIAPAAARPGDVTVWGTAHRGTVEWAALANAMGCHADETDDSHGPSRTHPGCSVVPAALAVAEALDRSGADLVRAVVLGYDLCARVPLALWPGLIDKSTERVPSTHAAGGLFGSAAAAAALHRLDSRAARHVLAYATQQLSGIRTYFGEGAHVEKAFVFAAMPAFNGVTAAGLVAAGFVANDDPFSGRPSLFDLGADPDPDALVDGLGTRHAVVATKFKKYPVGSPAQSPVDAVVSIMDTHALTDADVARVDVYLAPQRLATVKDRPIIDLNIDYLLESVVAEGTLSFARVHDHDAFAAWLERGPSGRITAHADPAFGTAHTARAVVETVDGRVLRHEVAAIPGSRDNPMSPDDVRRKAAALVAPVLGDAAAKELVEVVDRLDEVADLRDLTRLLTRNESP